MCHNPRRRLHEFMNSLNNCALNGWLINELEIQTRININKKIDEEIKFKYNF